MIVRALRRRRAWLLLLGLIPILGVLIFGGATFTRSGDRLDTVEREAEAASIASDLNENRNRVARVGHVFQAAALTGEATDLADQAVVLAAETVLVETRAPDIDAAALRAVEAMFDAPPDQRSQLSTAFLGELRSYRVGDLPGLRQQEIEKSLNRSVMSRVLPWILVQVDDVDQSATELFNLVNCDLQFDRDLRAAFWGALKGETIDLERLPSASPDRAVRWDEASQDWATRTPGGADLQGGPAAPAAEEDPIRRGFQDLLAARDSAAIQPAVAQLLEVDRSLGEAVDAARVELIVDFDALGSDIGRERAWITIVMLVLVGFGIALLMLTRGESLARSRSEAAHAAALNDLADKAYRDSLTGMRNRRWIEGELARQLDVVERTSPLSVALIDLDRFKSLNDAWGHSSGDRALVAVAERFKEWEADRPTICAARFGGDEFVAVIEASAEAAAREIEGLLESIADIRVASLDADVELPVQASAGVAQATDESRTADLLVEVDAALGQVKQNDRGSVRVYDRTRMRTSELLPALPSALERGDIDIEVQPIVDIRSGEIAHLEALARWRRAGAIVSPGDFVPLVETNGLSGYLTSAVLRKVSDERREVGPLPRTWVNVSPIELADRNFAAHLLSRIDEYGLPANELGIEVTETAAITNVQRVTSSLHDVREAGILAAIDDFGSGYTPVGFLRSLPVDIIKIDRELIAFIDQDPVRQDMVSSLARICARLRVEVVAEGVERSEELDWLQSSGVAYAQGFLLARPGPVKDLPLGRSVIV
ncbi:MAG: bifunctional diguanylate cyclase/phosphodiesterase [Actinomycetota bacterium]